MFILNYPPFIRTVLRAWKRCILAVTDRQAIEHELLLRRRRHHYRAGRLNGAEVVAWGSCPEPSGDDGAALETVWDDWHWHRGQP